MSETQMIESLEQQLRSLYEEREQLTSRFGVNSPEDLIGMVESLEHQLRDFYDRFGSNPGIDDAETNLMLAKIKELSSTLDPMYSKKTVQFFFEDEKPVLRAEWTESTDQGEQ